MSVTPFAVLPSSRPRSPPPRSGAASAGTRAAGITPCRADRLHLSTACPDGLRIAVAPCLLGLDDLCPVTFLDAVPDCPDGGHSALRPLYDMSAHRYTGAAAAPVLSDDWSGRIVSTHAPDIIRDLARHLGGGRPALYLCPGCRGGRAALDAAAMHRVAGHPALWAYARRLAAHPAFGPHLDLDGIARRHHAHCRGLEAAGAALQILDWAGHVGRRA